MKNLLPKFITYGLYPSLLLVNIIVCSLAINNGWDLKKVAATVSFPQFVILFTLEFIFPLKREWKMTWR
jgi:hypothetical protein